MSGVHLKIAIFVAVISAAIICSYIFFGNTWIFKDIKNQDNTITISSSESSGFMQKQPHIVFIIADDLGFNDVSYNGKLHGSAISTPNIDRLAAEGIILNNSYVQYLCTPTRASIMTGRYPINLGLQHDVILNKQPHCLPLDEVTLPEKLHEVGYATHAIGKWHLGFHKKECLPTRRGFDTFFGFYGQSADHFRHDFSDNIGNLNLSGYDLHQDTTNNFTTAWEQYGQYSTEIYSREAQKVIRRHAILKQPLFLYLAFLAPHVPLQVFKGYKKPYRHVIQDNDRRSLAGMMACLDEAIGNVTKALSETGLYDNTIILFSSDNGGDAFVGGNNWPLRGIKETLWEGGIRAAGFIHSPLLPDEVKGTSSQTLIHATDWFPTIVSSLAGGNLSGTNKLDGFDMWNSIIARSSSPRKELLHNIDPLFINATSVWGYSALRMGDWKLITGDTNLQVEGSWFTPPESGLATISPVEPPEKKIWLFNIAKDPTEKYDLSNERPGIVKRMLERLDKYNQTMVPPIFPSPDPNSDPALHGGVWGPWEKKNIKEEFIARADISNFT